MYSRQNSGDQGKTLAIRGAGAGGRVRALLPRAKISSAALLLHSRLLPGPVLVVQLLHSFLAQLLHCFCLHGLLFDALAPLEAALNRSNPIRGLQGCEWMCEGGQSRAGAVSKWWGSLAVDTHRRHTPAAPLPPPQHTHLAPAPRHAHAHHHHLCRSPRRRC